MLTALNALLRIALLLVAVTVWTTPLAMAQTFAVTPPAAEIQSIFRQGRPLFPIGELPNVATQARAELTVPSFSASEPAGPANPPAVTFHPTRLSKVFLYSLELMSIEQFVRVATQPDSRAELKGPFFRDWFDSVHVPKKWGDEDPWRTNYIGHAIHGAAAARIWLDQREPKAATRKQYLASMGRALVFTVIFSELFENGPISEASIGNVARQQERTGWVDHVWTPVGGVLWAMSEDAIDKYVIARIDRGVDSGFVRAAARIMLNPGRSLGSISQNRAPWYRANRPVFGPANGR